MEAPNLVQWEQRCQEGEKASEPASYPEKHFGYHTFPGWTVLP